VVWLLIHFILQFLISQSFFLHSISHGQEACTHTGISAFRQLPGFFKGAQLFFQGVGDVGEDNNHYAH